MKIGDVVIPTRGFVTEYGGEFVLHCGSGIYSHAIVASIIPFVLISSTGDMKWSATIKPEYFTPLCQASTEVCEIVQKRLKRGT